MVWGELIGRVDEILGAGMLSMIAVYAMYSGIDGGIAEACVAGVIALLAVGTSKKK